MDYILHEALNDAGVERVCITYDIWCKFHVNLSKRANERFEAEFTKGFRNMIVRGYVPKFHLPAHGPACHTIWSLNYADKAGRLDGEGPEREWAVTNELRRQTMEMGPGHCHGVLNDHINWMNFRRLTRLCEYQAPEFTPFLTA
jgi:hypothetical protein